MAKDGEDVSMRYAAGFPVSRGQAQASGEAQQTSGTSGPRWPESSASAGRATCLQRTFLWPHSPNPGETFEGWATESRQLSASLRRTLARRTSASDGGCWVGTPTASQNVRSERWRRRMPSPQELVRLPTPTAKANMLSPSMQKWPAHRNLLPTPKASDADRGGRGELLHFVKSGTPRGKPTLPTPTARDWKSGKASPATMARNSRPLSKVIGGLLAPAFVEWLMGFPRGWTDCAPLATARFRAWQRRHGAS